ncbi:MAG: thioredoxin [Bacteroidales bacterium]|nr:thioredoxin [Bacteroidales bacterium]
MGHLKSTFIKKIAIILAMFLPLFSFSQVYQTKNIGAQEFFDSIQNKDVSILDVRTLNEFNGAHIAKAININIYDPNFQNSVLTLPKDKPVYVYCLSGNRSLHAANFLIQSGYTKVYNLTRGIISWNALSLPVEKNITAQATPQVNNYSISQFESIINSEKIIFVDFYAPWCAPCKEMMPMMEELEKEYAGKIKIIKVNTDASKELTSHLKIASIPYLVLYKEGKPLFKYEGKLTKQELITQFNQNL